MLFFTNPFAGVEILDGVRDTGLEFCNGVVVECAVTDALEVAGG